MEKLLFILIVSAVALKRLLLSVKNKLLIYQKRFSLIIKQCYLIA